MKVSVIIPVWNGREYLLACLDALLAQEYQDLEVIAVDNASTDGSADLVAERYPQVRLIRNRVNLGFAGGCNVGLRAAQGDVLVLLNQDTRVLPGWLRALVDALRQPKVGVVGCKILYPDGKTIQHAGGRIEWPLGMAYHYGKGERDDGQWDEPRQVEYVTGAAMAFRRDVLERVGLLDEEFWPGYFEDTDFCFRVRETGYEVRYVPDSVLIHTETTATGDPLAVSCAYERGRLRFVLKHLPPSRFLAEFVPAEERQHRSLIQGPEGDPLRIAYLGAIPMAARILRSRWQADKGTVEAVLMALQSLHRPPTYRIVDEAPGEKKAISPLEEFEFRSMMPVIGPLVAWLRSAWYNVAARWAVRYLIQQQNGINQRQEMYVRSLERRLSFLERRLSDLERRLSEEETFLAREIAGLTCRETCAGERLDGRGEERKG